MRRILASLILVIFVNIPLNAKNYFVSPDGNDNNDGLNSTTAWATIDNGDQKGLLSPGDTLNILPGTYLISNTIHLQTHGTVPLPIVYHKYGKGDVLIDADNKSNIILLMEGDNVEVSGLDLTKTNDNAIHIKSNSCKIANCFIFNTGKIGIRVEGNDNLFLKNVISNTADDAVRNEGAGHNNLYYGNTIYSGNHDGIELNETTARVFNNIIVKNDKGIKGAAGNVCGFNNVWGNAGGDYNEGVFDSAGGMSVAPQFVDTAAGRFDLKHTDNEINAGLYLGYPFNGSAPEIGAFEKYNVYYVSPSGDDSNSGLTLGTAWATIDNGDSLLFPGDTIYVLKGTYTDSVVITDSGLADDKITYKGVRDSTFIDGGGLTTAVTIDASGIVWSGISVFDAEATNMLITGSNNLIEYSRFRNAGDRGIHLKDGIGNSFNALVIDSSLVYGLFIAASCKSSAVSNCTFYGNYSAAIFDQSGKTIILNSILACNIGIGLRASASKAGYSIFYNNGTDVVGGATIDSTCIFEDPLLIEPETGNFRLNSLSPAIDAGIDVGLPYSGDAPDIGAYETSPLVALTVSPSFDSLFADSTYQFYIAAIDSSGYPANPGEITWSHTFATGIIDSNGLFTPQLIDTGSVVATSSINGIADTTENMLVVPGTLDSLYIIPHCDTVSADSTLQFTVNGFDIHGNNVSEFGTLDWSVDGSIGVIDINGLFSAIRAGYGFISVESDIGPVAMTDFILVIPGEIAYVNVIPALNSVDVDSSFQYSAKGYDSDSNFVYNITDSVVWSTTDPAGFITDSGLYTAGENPSPPDYFVKAVYEGTLSDSGAVTVVGIGALNYIVIELEDGTPFDDSTLTTDNDSTVLYCRGYDSGNNLIGNISVTWSLVDGDSIGSIAPGPDASTVLTITDPGTGKAVATHVSGLSDTTGIITVETGLPAYLSISPDTITVSADSSVQFTAQVFDADSNECSLSLADWSVLGGIGTTDDDGLFTPSTTGFGNVVVTGSGLTDTSGTVTVTPGILHRIVISPDTAVISVDDSIQFTADGYDVKSNPADVGHLSWLVLGQAGNIDSSGLFIANHPGICNVMVFSNINGVSDISGAVNVKALFVSNIPLGHNTGYPGQGMIPVLAFRIDNFYDTIKTISSITIRDTSSGEGDLTELLTNLDSVSLYYDIENDSALTLSDSFITNTGEISGVMTLSFAPIDIQPDSVRTFIVCSKISQYPHDGDSLDLYFLPSIDIIAGDGTTIKGPGILNSLGCIIIDGMTSGQITQIPTGVTEISPADSLYNVFTVDIPRNGYRNDTLDIFSIYNYGTASDSDIDSLILFFDDGNGFWDGRGTESCLGTLVYTGNRWMRSGLNAPLTWQNNRFYVGVRLFDYPANNATLALAIPENGLEMTSQNDGPIDAGCMPLDTIIIRTTEAIKMTGFNIASRELTPGSNSGPLLAIEIVNSYISSINLDSVRININAVDPGGASQTQLDGQFDSLLLYINRDGDFETMSAADSLIATTLIQDGTALFGTSGLSIAGGGGKLELFAAAMLDADNCKNGNLVKPEVNDSTDFYFTQPIFIEGSFPLTNENYFIINNFPSGNVIINNVNNHIVYGGQTNQPALDFVLPPNGYASDSLASLRIIDNGTLLGSTKLLTLKLRADKTNNGFSVDDSLLGQFTAYENYWQLSNLHFPIGSTGSRFIVTMNIGNGQFEAATIQLGIPIGGAVYRSGTDGPDDISVANPQAIMVFPSNRMTVISIPAASSVIRPKETNSNILTFALYNGYLGQEQAINGITLTNISRSQSDQAYADYELGQVSLYFDANRDRIFGESQDSLIGIGNFNESELHFTGFDVALPPESLSYFFALADFPQALIDSDSLAVSIAGPSDFSFSGTVNVNGDLPLITGGYLIVDGSIASQYELVETMPRTLSPGDTAVTLFAFKPAYNGNLEDILNSLIIVNAGNADTSDISTLELWSDLNGDNIRQSTDSLMGTLDYRSDRWELDSLILPIDGARPALFVLGDVSMTATPDVTFKAEIPLNGCLFGSGNDGPIDSAINAPASFTISASGLQIANQANRETYSVGQTIELGVTVTNILGGAIDSVRGAIVEISDSSLVTFDSSDAGPVILATGESTDFTFYYTAAAAGEVCWQVLSYSESSADSSAIIQSANIRIQQSPSDVVVQMLNSAPISVTRGQANVFPLSIGFAHPDSTLATASLRLDSIILGVENSSGQSIYADDVFSRIKLATEYSNLVVLQNISHVTEVVLNFNQPIIVDPGHGQFLSLLVDIDSSASADNFILTVNDADHIPITDENTGLTVSLAPEVIFPFKTASCRIDDASERMVVSSRTLLNSFVNYGQKDVDVLQLKFRHPDSAGSSQIQLTDLSIMFVDDFNDTLVLSDLLDLVRIKRQQSIVAEVGNFAPGARQLDIQLNSPLTLNGGVVDSLVVQVWINENTTAARFGLLIPDSTFFVVRDGSSGSPLAMATDTVYTLASGSEFPITSSLATLESPAISPELCIESLLPTSVAGGVDSLDLLAISLDYPAGIGYAPIRLDNIFITVFDSIGTPLDPDRLFDRIGYHLSGSPVDYQAYIELLGGRIIFNIDSNGYVFNTGDSQIVYLTADIETDVPYENFVLEISTESEIKISDYNDTTHIPGFILEEGCTTEFPFITGQTNVFLPAGRPLLTIRSLPVQLAYRGQQGAVFSYSTLDYSTKDLQGDLVLGGITGQVLNHTTDGMFPVTGNTVFSAIYLLADDEIVAIDSVLDDDTLRLIPPNPFSIANGSTIEMSLTCDLRNDAPRGNYLVGFQDSTFTDLTDLNLSSVVYPILTGAGFPLKTAEISVVTAGLENSYTNYPNPFNPARGVVTTIGYALPEDAYVDIDIYTVTGELVKKVVSNEFKAVGSHQEDSWSGDNDAGRGIIPGTYFCRITARYTSGKTESFRRKIAVVR